MEGFGFAKGRASLLPQVLIDRTKELLPDCALVRGRRQRGSASQYLTESMQDSSLVQKINKVLTKRFLKLLEEKANKEPEVYADFWSKFGIFLKEGVTTDFTHRDQLLKLLRFESSYTKEKENTNLADYLSRAPEEQKEIYYLSGASRKAIETGPYYEAFKARNIEVLFLLEPIDEFVMNHARSFEEKNFVSADNDAIDLDAIAPETETEKPEALEDSACSELCTFLKEQMGDQVEDVSASDRLVGSPAMIVNADKMMTAQMRKMMRAMQQQGGVEDKEPPVKLQINPRHPLIKNLATLRQDDNERSDDLQSNEKFAWLPDFWKILLPCCTNYGIQKNSALNNCFYYCKSAQILTQPSKTTVRFRSLIASSFRLQSSCWNKHRVMNTSY